MDDYAEEDIRIDPSDMDASFRRGIRSSGIEYVEELQKMAMNDYELEGEGEEIARAFDLLKKYIQSNGNYIGQLKLKDLIEFNLSRDIVNRIGYLAFQYDSISPMSTLSKKQKSFNNPSEDYDDDFEVDEEPDVQAHGDHYESSDELYIDNSPIKTPTYVVNRYDTKQSGIANTGSSDLEDIEDETYDNHRNKYSKNTSTPQPSHIHPRISPEIHYISNTKQDNNISNRSSHHISPPKPAVVASAAFIQVSKPSFAYTHSAEPTPTSTSTNNTTDNNNSNSRASTAGGVLNKRSTGTTSTSRISRNSQNGRIKTASWIENRQWRLGEKIGSGAFGEVFQGLNDKGMLFAVKRMAMANQPSEIDNLLAEIQLMRGLSHPHIVEYLGAWVDTEEGNLYIFQEWVPGGSVAHLLKQFGPFSISVVREYTKQILLGLCYLHQNGIIHRDIKGGNILVDANRTVKLADFGASTQLTQFNQTQITTTVKGTPYFMAPEVLASSRYGRKGDIWAVGCTMIQMLTGEPPWKDRNLKGLVQLHLLLTSWENGPPPYNCYVTPEARECLELCFQKEDTKRPTAMELLKCKFLDYADELDESIHNLNGSIHDPLEDSGILKGLKSDMNIVVTRSTAGMLKHSSSSNDDTIGKIESQLAKRAQQKKSTANIPYSTSNTTPTPTAYPTTANPNSGNNKTPGNPFGYQQNPRPSSRDPTRQVNFSHIQPQPQQYDASPVGVNNNASSVGSPERINRWDIELPPGQFNDSPARYGQPLTIPPPVSIPIATSSQSTNSTPVSVRTPASHGTVMGIATASPPTSNNPFARGAISVKKSIAMSPTAAAAGSSGSSTREEGMQQYSPAEIITPRLAAEHAYRARMAGGGSSSSSNSGIYTPGGRNSAAVSPSTADMADASLVRDSLQVLKKRNPSAGSSRRPIAANSGGRYSSHSGNISSNRDTEELTPMPQDLSDHEGQTPIHYRNATQAAFQNRYREDYSNDMAENPYDSSDPGEIDEESQLPIPLQQSDSLASIEEEVLQGSDMIYNNQSHYQEDSHNMYQSNSRNNSTDSKGPPPSWDYNPPDSQYPVRMNAPYIRPKTQSRDHTNTKFTSSGGVGTAGSAGGTGAYSMKKSSSDFGRNDAAALAIAQNRYPRREVTSAHHPNTTSSSNYTNIGHKNNSSSGNSNIERRIKPYPMEKKSVSASVRRSAPISTIDAHARPYTSKASFTSNTNASSGGDQQYNNTSSRNSSAGSQNSNNSRKGKSTNIHSNSSVLSEEVSSDEDDVWLCLKCGAENNNSSHCEHCATVRGADGRRGLGAPLHRF